MRAHLFSDTNKIADTKEHHSLWFCDMQKCGGDVEISPPTVLQCFGGSGVGLAFFGKSDVFLQNVVAIFGGGDVCLYPKLESGTCHTCEEFVSGVVHMVNCYVHSAVVHCSGVSFEVCGNHFEYCDCVNIQGRDYIFLKFAKSFACLLWNGCGYVEIFNIPATSYYCENGVCKVTFIPKISSGATLYCEISLSHATDAIKNLQFARFKLENPENFNFFTFENYFFELLFVARLVPFGRAKSLLSPYLASDLQDAVDGILEFLGEFCGIVPHANGGVVLIYQHGENRFETRMFETQVFYNQNGAPVVENISETENFQLEKESFEDFSKFMITFQEINCL